MKWLRKQLLMRLESCMVFFFCVSCSFSVMRAITASSSLFYWSYGGGLPGALKVRIYSEGLRTSYEYLYQLERACRRPLSKARSCHWSRRILPPTSEWRVWTGSPFALSGNLLYEPPAVIQIRRKLPTPLLRRLRPVSRQMLDPTQKL